MANGPESESGVATEATGPDGVARFAPALLHGEAGMAPAALHLTGPDGDFTVLNLTRPAFDLADRGVSGRPQPGPRRHRPPARGGPGAGPGEPSDRPRETPTAARPPPPGRPRWNTGTRSARRRRSSAR